MSKNIILVFVQSIPSHPISVKIYFILLTHLRLGLPSSLFSLWLSHQYPNILYAFLFSPIRATFPVHLILLDHSNYTCRVHVIISYHTENWSVLFRNSMVAYSGITWNRYIVWASSFYYGFLNFIFVLKQNVTSVLYIVPLAVDFSRQIEMFSVVFCSCFSCIICTRVMWREGK
jgi:hypothetical protein